jgi:hypothetical protein
VIQDTLHPQKLVPSRHPPPPVAIVIITINTIRPLRPPPNTLSFIMKGKENPNRSFLHTLYKRKTKTPSTTSSQNTPSHVSEGPSVQIVESLDTQRTRTRYKNAVEFLQDAIEAHGGNSWQGIQLSTLEGEIQDLNDSHFRKHIDEALEVQNISINNQGAWEKCMHTIQCMITALSPFAKHFLTILHQGSSV